jgi:renalase
MAQEVPAMEQVEVLVIGAGVAGLACARALADAGLGTVVLERARGVGGRCATRRIDGRPVDHGVVFLHGSDPALLAALAAVDSPRRDGWPTRVQGAGAPCQPAAFQPWQSRVAFEAGVSVFPKLLARGLDIRLGQDVLRLAAGSGAIVAATAAGAAYRSRTVVLALALEETRAVLDGIGPDGESEAAPAGDELVAVRRLLATLSTVPCLTLIAGYPSWPGGPAWDIAYPEDSKILQLVSHDSSKHPDASITTLVYQARPAWSRRHLEDVPASWSAEMLGEAGRLFGERASAPAWTQAHRWRHARLEVGNELAAPMLLEPSDGIRLGLAGELFGAGGGVQAAFASGRHLADRIVGSRPPGPGEVPR